MDNSQKKLLELKEFADSMFANPNEELQTTYQNRKIRINDLPQAYSSHQQILEMQLQDRIEELLAKENDYKRESLFRAFPQQH